MTSEQMNSIDFICRKYEVHNKMASTVQFEKIVINFFTQIEFSKVCFSLLLYFEHLFFKFEYDQL